MKPVIPGTKKDMPVIPDKYQYMKERKFISDSLTMSHTVMFE